MSNKTSYSPITCNFYGKASGKYRPSPADVNRLNATYDRLSAAEKNKEKAKLVLKEDKSGANKETPTPSVVEPAVIKMNAKEKNTIAEMKDLK